MSHTPYLNVIPQRAALDCAVACVAMLCGVTYEAALLAFKREPIHGVRTRDIHAAARRLGHPLRWSRVFDLENDTGLLSVRSTKWKTDHLVVLKEGLIVDTDATLWEADIYLAAYDARPMSLMTAD